MSDTDEAQAQLNIEAETSGETAPKKKVARKRGRPRKTATSKEEKPAKASAQDDAPAIFSASPDDMDDYGDVQSRRQREQEETKKPEPESTPEPRKGRQPRPQKRDAQQRAGSSSEDSDNASSSDRDSRDNASDDSRGNSRDEARNDSRSDSRDDDRDNTRDDSRSNARDDDRGDPRDGSRDDRGNAGDGSRGDSRDDSGQYSNDNRNRDNRPQGNQGGGNPNFNKDRKNKFERYKGKKDFKNQGGGNPNYQQGGSGGNPNYQQGGGNPNFQQGGGKNNKFKKGKKPKWQGAPGFGAANDDEMDPPSFESLIDWDLFKTNEALADFISLNVDPDKEPLNYNELYEMTLPQMEQAAKETGVNWEGAPSRAKIIRAFLQHARETKQAIHVNGLVEVLETGHAFLVFAKDSFRLRTDSPFISLELVDRLGLQRGHQIDGLMNAPKENETCPFLLRVDQTMGRDPESIQHLTPFTELTPYYPTARIVLESAEGALGKWDNISMRVVDLLSPVGLGQRGLIVAPPRTGKTVLLQGIANAIRVNKPDVKLIVLLVDERPEEVTDFKRTVKGAEVISSTFDESAESHVHAAEMVIEKARRMVECGEDVIILLDSITRLARAYNTLMPSSGKILSGGVEASALQKPKRFFGSARNIEEGGSLTILGTALVDTGSKMDEVIFEEFKGTGNMELHLDRDLSNKRVFPALSFERSGTRKEELLYHPDEMAKVYALRRAMKGVPSTEAMEMLITRIKKTKTNAEFLMGMAR